MNGPLSLSQWRRPKQDDLDVIPSDVDQTQFPVLFARNDERNAVRLQNRGDRELFEPGGLGASARVVRRREYSIP
jgi:hypothetical protein